jgi:hypothetical protein
MSEPTQREKDLEIITTAIDQARAQIRIAVECSDRSRLGYQTIPYGTNGRLSPAIELSRVLDSLYHLQDHWRDVR